MIKREELTNPESCMSRAREDEMTFVLLARDAAAPATIRAWIAERIRLGKNHPNDSQMAEAAACAAKMEASTAPSRAPYQHQTRCVKCGYAEVNHDPNKPAELTGGPCRTFRTLNLPPGKTCGDCVHTARCVDIFGHIPEDRSCDWFPIRFQERTQGGTTE